MPQKSRRLKNSIFFREDVTFSTEVLNRSLGQTHPMITQDGVPPHKDGNTAYPLQPTLPPHPHRRPCHFKSVGPNCTGAVQRRQTEVGNLGRPAITPRGLTRTGPLFKSVGPKSFSTIAPTEPSPKALPKNGESKTQWANYCIAANQNCFSTTRSRRTTHDVHTNPRPPV